MSDIERMWRPAAPEGAADPFETIEAEADDWYVTVDDIDGARMHLVATGWPALDGEGRLVFPAYDARTDGPDVPDPPAQEITVGTGDFQEFVNRRRAEGGQLAVSRDVRVGDTFWYRGNLPREGGEIDGQAIDVTFAARAEAKAAMIGAIGGPDAVPTVADGAGSVRRRAAERRPPADTSEPVRPSLPGSVAGPSV